MDREKQENEEKLHKYAEKQRTEELLLLLQNLAAEERKQEAEERAAAAEMKRIQNELKNQELTYLEEMDKRMGKAQEIRQVGGGYSRGYFTSLRPISTHTLTHRQHWTLPTWQLLKQKGGRLTRNMRSDRLRRRHGRSKRTVNGLHTFFFELCWRIGKTPHGLPKTNARLFGMYYTHRHNNTHPYT